MQDRALRGVGHDHPELRNSTLQEHLGVSSGTEEKEGTVGTTDGAAQETLQERGKEMKFNEWWDENEKEYLSDALHMSEYHMASVIWEAAQKALRGSSCLHNDTVSIPRDADGNLFKCNACGAITKSPGKSPWREP